MNQTQPKTTKCIAKEIQGHLAIPIANEQRKYYKFCYWCGHKLRADKRALKRHFDVLHPDKNAAFLDFDLLPEACRYLNFEDFINGETSDLIEKSDAVGIKGGKQPIQP